MHKVHYDERPKSCASFKRTRTLLHMKCHIYIYEQTLQLNAGVNGHAVIIKKLRPKWRTEKRRESRTEMWRMRTGVRRCWLRRAFLCRGCGTYPAFLVPPRRRQSSCARYCRILRTRRSRYLYTAIDNTSMWWTKLAIYVSFLLHVKYTPASLAN